MKWKSLKRFVGRHLYLEENPLHISRLCFEKAMDGKACQLELTNGQKVDRFMVSAKAF